MLLMNEALLENLFWRYGEEKDRLRRRVIVEKYREEER